MPRSLRRPLIAVVFALVITGVGTATAATCVVGPDQVYTTIQSAIDDPGCTTVQVLPGKYPEQLTIARSVIVVGTGQRSTVVQAPAAMVEPFAIIRVNGAGTSARLRLMSVDGGATTQHRFGIKVDGGAHAEILDTRIRSPFRAGFFVPIQVGDVTSGESGRADISNNRPEYYEPVAIVVEGAGSAAVIQNNTIDAGVARSAPAVPLTGIRISDGATAQIGKNRVTDHGYRPARADAIGIHLRNAAGGVTVSTNTLQRNDVGILVEDTDEIDIRLNRLTTSPVAAVAADGSAGTTFYLNRVLDAGVGFDLTAVTSSLLSKNQVRETTAEGFLLTSSTGNLVTTNVSYTTGGFPYEDDSHGTGTAGTANTYTSNRCLRTAVSSPAGLCR